MRLILVGGGNAVSHPGVIDVGFSPEPAAWIASCDYIVSANRQSYFDLSIMEALSLGTPAIICCTGGHKEFLNLASEGIVALEAADATALCHAFLQCKIPRAENQKAVESNLALYGRFWTSSKYRERIEEFLAR